MISLLHEMAGERFSSRRRMTCSISGGVSPIRALCVGRLQSSTVRVNEIVCVLGSPSSREGQKSLDQSVPRTSVAPAADGVQNDGGSMIGQLRLPAL